MRALPSLSLRRERGFYMNGITNDQQPIITYETAIQSMVFLAQSTHKELLKSVGINEANVRKLMQDAYWLGPERYTVENTFRALMAGSMRIVGLTDYDVPVEFLAAGIAIFVKPCNARVACGWLERPYTARDLASGGTTLVPVSARQLMALVIMLYQCTEKNYAVSLLEQKIGILMREAQILGPSANKEKGGD